MSKNVDEILKTICNAPTPSEREYEISLKDIEPNPQQYRLCFDDKSIQELAATINKEGLLQAIIVRKNPNPNSRQSYQIVVGERRYRASIFLGKETIRAKIRNVADDELLSYAAVENIRRANGTVLDNANLAQMLMNEKKGDISALKEILPWGYKQIKRYLHIYREVNRTPEFFEIFREKAADIDFTTAYNFSQIALALAKLKHSNRREYNRAIFKLWEKGVKNALPWLQKKLGEKNKQATKQPLGQYLYIETKEKKTCIIFSATWTGEKPISTEDRQQLQSSFTAYLERIGAAVDSDGSKPIDKVICERETAQI